MGLAWVGSGVGYEVVEGLCCARDRSEVSRKPFFEVKNVSCFCVTNKPPNKQTQLTFKNHFYPPTSPNITTTFHLNHHYLTHHHLHHHLPHHHLTHHHHPIHHFIQHHHSTQKILQTSSLPHTFTTQISSHSLPISNIYPQNPSLRLQFSLAQPPNHQFPLLSATLQNLILFKISQKKFRLRRTLRAALRARPPADASGVRLRCGASGRTKNARIPILGRTARPYYAQGPPPRPCGRGCGPSGDDGVHKRCIAGGSSSERGPPESWPPESPPFPSATPEAEADVELG